MSDERGPRDEEPTQAIGGIRPDDPDNDATRIQRAVPQYDSFQEDAPSHIPVRAGVGEGGSNASSEKSVGPALLITVFLVGLLIGLVAGYPLFHNTSTASSLPPSSTTTTTVPDVTTTLASAVPAVPSTTTAPSTTTTTTSTTVRRPLVTVPATAPRAPTTTGSTTTTSNALSISTATTTRPTTTVSAAP